VNIQKTTFGGGVMPIYMDYPGIKGSATGKYAGWIELDSCSIGVARGVSSAEAGLSSRDDAHPPELIITKHQDSTSTQLFNESVRGSGATVTIDFNKAGDDLPYLSIEMTETMISSIYVSGYNGTGKSTPLETLTLNYYSIKYSNRAMSSNTGTPDKASWDLVTSKYNTK
jgi:type VI protein secretion system component Hcp